MSSRREQEPLSFKLFPNKYKTKDKQPDYRGTLTDKDGKEWDISGWALKTKNGDKWVGGKISDAEENRKKFGDKKKEAEGKQVDESDDLPF